MVSKMYTLHYILSIQKADTAYVDWLTMIELSAAANRTFVVQSLFSHSYSDHQEAKSCELA